MNQNLLYSCEQLIRNRDVVKSVFAWDGGIMNLACAGIYTTKGLNADQQVLKACRNMLESRTGVFSNFRSTARCAIVAQLATGLEPENTLENGLYVYQLLKQEFYTSTFLPLTAMMIAQFAQPEQYEQIAHRTHSIYNNMKKNHPFLTSSEDSAFCALMALSEKSDENLLSDAEQYYEILNHYFFSSNAVQSLSHVLALCDGDPQWKCGRTIQLFDMLKAAGYKYGTSYELATLGVLAMTDSDLNLVVRNMIEIDNWLESQKGFGFFSGISRKQRLMYAGILAEREFINTNNMQTAAIGGTISLVVAQQAAMCAAVAASAAASSSNGAS